MRKMLLIALSACVLAGCMPVNLDRLSINEASVKKSTFHDRNGNFEIELPPGWTMAKQGELNEHADFEVKNVGDDMFIAALMTNKEDVTFSFNEFRDKAVKKVEALYGVVIDKPADVKTAGYTGSAYEFDGVNGDLKFHMWLYMIETQRYYGQLLVWTTKSKAQKNAAALKAAVESFKETAGTSTRID